MRKLGQILLIDDDYVTNFLNHEILKRKDVAEEITVFDSAIKAMEVLKEQETNCPDFILLDLNMPGMNGWEFLDEFRSLPLEQREKIAVFILSTSRNPDDIERSGEYLEVKGYVEKPLDAIQIEEIVEKVTLG